MGNFNMLQHEIISDILSRLPAESALECKLVAKPWRDAVHDTSFSQMHMNHIHSAAADTSGCGGGKSTFLFYCLHQDPVEFYYSEEYGENRHWKPFSRQRKPFSRKTRINLRLPFENYSPIGSCNGLICFRSSADGYEGPACIANPMTREYVVLPSLRGSFWCTGFGYCSSTKEYKVVRINWSRVDSSFGMVQVYTLGSGTGWRNAVKIDIDRRDVGQDTGVFANGALHWVGYQGTTIFSFRLGDEKFNQIPPPPPSLRRASVPFMSMILRGLGCFLSAAYHFRDSGYELWILKKNKQSNEFSWSNEFSSDRNIAWRPFGYTKCGRLLWHELETKYTYDPKRSSTQMVVNFGKFITGAIPHNNTLVSLKELGEKDTITIDYGEKASSSGEKENRDKLKKPEYKVKDQIVVFCDMCVASFMVPCIVLCGA